MRRTSARGVPPEQVAQTIERALTAPRMKARYVVGRDARAMLLAKRLLPAHVFDRFARRARSARETGSGGGGYTASQANTLVVAACVCSIPGSA